MRLLIATFFFALTSLAPALAQTGKLFSVDKELSSSLINHVYQDHLNVVWISTSDGLNRYDGSKFTIYKHDRNDSTSLLHNYVRVVFEDSNHRLFIGCFNGLQYYDYATETFHDVPLILADGNRFPAHIMTIIERRNGDVLVATSGHGVFLIKSDNGRIQAHQQTELSPSFMVGHVYEDSNHALWIATQDKGLFRLESGAMQSYFTTSENGTIFSMCEDRNRNLYVGSVATGLYVYDRDSDSFQSLGSGSYSNLSINKIYLTRSGEMLIGTEGDGLKKFDPVERKISEGNFSINTLDFSKSKIHSIMEDMRGNIWLGIHQKGAVLLPFNKNNFRYYGFKSVNNNTIGSNMVTALYTDRHGILWVGTDGDGLYGLSQSGEQVAHFSKKTDQSVPCTILSIYEDTFGDLWLGSYDKGLARLNRKTGHCEYVNHLFEKRNGEFPRVFSIVEDNDNNLWVATMGAGLYAMDLITRKVEHYVTPQGANYRDDANTLHSDWLFSLYRTHDDKLFIGSVDGMGCLDLKTRSFNTMFGVNRMLPGLMVSSFFEDRDTVWIGTTDGLRSLSTATRQFQTYTKIEGLPSNMICSIQGDRSGNLWISTNYGISRMNPQKKTFINYYADDGLQGNEFSRSASHVNIDGTIIFGGINGITLFKPEEIQNDPKTLEVNITGFYIHNQPVTKGMTSAKYPIVNASVMESDTFQISHKDNSFTIEFSSMEFANPERITYQYRLSSTADWITLPTGMNNVTFSNLQPGSYDFQIRARDYNTYSNAKTISIVVHPAWYFSRGAQVLYALMAISLLSIFIQLKRQRRRAKEKLQEHLRAKEMHEAKLQFFINIAHEIRTPMSLILSPLKKLMLKDKDRERQRAYFTMNENSERIVRLINQLMDIRKIDKGQMDLRFREVEMVSFIREICLTFKDAIQARKINLRFNHAVRKLTAYIDPDNFDKVLMNIFANALKFTPDNGNITIHLDNAAGTSNDERTYFQIVVSDTGPGIAGAELEKVFECFYQTRESKQSFRDGTGIGLHLTKSIVELHQGSIRAENNENSPGCRFIVRLPLGKDHLNEDDIMPDTVAPQEPEPVMIRSALSIAVPEAKMKSRNKHRVLVVDDDKSLREYLCMEMSADYHMDKCADGKEALTYILKHNPDLVIADIVMPEMDGITLCRKVKHNVNINHIPVVLLTARKDEQFNIQGLGIGADAYIVKPFNIEIVRKTVQNIIRNRELLRNRFSGKQKHDEKITDIHIQSPDEKLMAKVMSTINDNLTNPALSVEMLAREIGISRVHLHRKLKELTNQSTRDLIRNIRLNQAANLLSEGHFNISEVAFAVGFTNAAHFSNVFKELYGMSPTEYMDDKREH